MTKVNIVLEQENTEYRISCPEIQTEPIEGDSLETVIEQLKEMLQSHLEKKELSTSESVGESLLLMAAKFNEELTEAEKNQLPVDAAQQHDHYLYGTPKR